MPIKSDAFIAGYALLQRVIKLACQLSATSYPERYAKRMYKHCIRIKYDCKGTHFSPHDQQQRQRIINTFFTLTFSSPITPNKNPQCHKPNQMRQQKNKVVKVVSRLSKFSEKRARQPISYNPHNPPTKNRARQPKIRLIREIRI